MTLYWIGEDETQRFTSETVINPGDKVYYYLTNSGWGGGETYKLFAIVERVTAQRVVISLWNGRFQDRWQKTVRRESLSVRTLPFPALDGTSGTGDKS